MWPPAVVLIPRRAGSHVKGLLRTARSIAGSSTGSACCGLTTALSCIVHEVFHIRRPMPPLHVWFADIGDDCFESMPLTESAMLSSLVCGRNPVAEKVSLLLRPSQGMRHNLVI